MNHLRIIAAFIFMVTISFPAAAGKPTSLVQGISAEADPFEKNAARIQWKLAVPSKTGIFIGRSNVPIINEETLQKAVNISGDGLSPGATSFLDKNLPDGVYYYIVLTGEDLENRFGLPFEPGGNFTVTPFIVNTVKPESESGPEKKPEPETQSKPPETKPEPEKTEEVKPEPQQTQGPGDSIYMVRNLTAVSTVNSVKLNWQPAPSIGIRYNIYRSSLPLNSPSVLRRARIIGTASENTLFFEDPRPAEDQEVFYAVTVTPLETGEEKAALQYGNSYISHIFKKTDEDPLIAKEESLLPENLRAETFGRNAVRISWDIPSEKVLEFRIYRSSFPLTGAERLQGAVFLGSVSGRETDYVDRDLDPGQYFYAVLPRDGRGKEIYLFKEGRSFTGFAGTVRPDLMRSQAAQNTMQPSSQAEKPVYSMMFLKGEIRDNDVHLFWDGTPGTFPDTKLYVYRSSQPLRNQYEIERSGILIAMERPEKKEFTDRKPGESILYYAVQVYRDGKPDPKLVESVNFLKEPLILKKEPEKRTEPVKADPPPPEETEEFTEEEEIKPPERKNRKPFPESRTGRPEPEERKMSPEERRDLLTSVLRGDYSDRRFGSAVKRLAPLTSEKLNPDFETRSAALFYTALSYYNMGDFRSAMDLFSHPDVQKAYPMRWNFWYRRSLEKLSPNGINLHP